MKKRWGKLLALALGASMVFNLAACGTKTEEKTSGSKTSTTSQTASASKTSNTASKTSDAKTDEIVNLKWVQVGSGQPDNMMLGKRISTSI